MELNSKETRLDIEIYVMGDMKLEFMVFLGDCFKNDFVETLSWGNFRRFQLVLSRNNTWINLFFIVIKNESASDILINCFKIFEKRNFIMLMYNLNDKKTEKVDALFDNLIAEKNKFYEDILKDESITKNYQKIQNDGSKSPVVSEKEIKIDLNYLTSTKDTLIYKIGFQPNITNKKTKNIKKNDVSSYDIEDSIFTLNEGEKIDFNNLFEFIVKHFFEKFSIDTKYLNDIVDLDERNSENNKLAVKENDKSTVSNFMKIVHLSIFLYILICFYKFYYY